MIGLPPVSQADACSALSNTCEEMPVMNNEYKKRHDYVISELNKIEGVNCRPTDGTFYVFPSFKKFIELNSNISNDSELALYILEKAKVAVVPGSAFGIEGHIRISIAIDLDSLKDAMQRLHSTLKL